MLKASANWRVADVHYRDLRIRRRGCKGGELQGWEVERPMESDLRMLKRGHAPADPPLRIF